MATVLVTGASGLIGKAVTEHLLRKGYSVRALVRMANAVGTRADKLEEIIGDVRDRDVLTKAAEGVDAVVHLAARKADEADSREINVGGAANLIGACKRAGVQRVINVSSQSVRLPKRGTYADTKLAADKLFEASGLSVTTLRPSIVYSDSQSGIFGSLSSFAKLPVVPVIGSGSPLFWPIHRDDLAEIIERCITHDATTGRTYDVGGPEGVSINDLLREIFARSSPRPVVHLPPWFAMAIAHIPGSPITKSNVLGADQELTMDISPIVRDTGFTPRGITGMFDLIFGTTNPEARALLSHVMSGFGKCWRPSVDHEQRYVIACRSLRVDPKHHIDSVVLRHPFLLGCLDTVTRAFHPHCTLQRKLLIATAIAECSPESADALLPRDRTRMEIVVACADAVARSAVKLLLGLPLLCVPSFYTRNAGR